MALGQAFNGPEFKRVNTGAIPTSPGGQEILSQEIADQQFQAASQPLQAQFARERKATEEELAQRGVQYGGTGDQARDRVAEAQSRALATLQGQITSQQLQRDFSSREAELGREFQRGQITDDRLFSLARSGQLQGTGLNEALESLGIDANSFLTDNEADLQAYAASKGMTIDQAKKARAIIGDILFQDIQANPSRYADIAVDPEEARQKELELQFAAQGKQVPYELLDERRKAERDELQTILRNYNSDLSLRNNKPYQFGGL